MGLLSRLQAVLLFWVVWEGCCVDLLGFPESPFPWAQRDLGQTPPPAVTVRCEEALLVVTVQRDLFGTGRLVRAEDVTLGLAACPPMDSDPMDTTVTFEIGLHECGTELQMTSDSLIYRTVLYYSPSPARNPLIMRTNPVSVPIECRYPRKDNVSSRAIQPTWVPFHSTLWAEERLGFSLRLMTDDWSMERSSLSFQLGEILHIQADVQTGHHVPLRLFIDHCVATPTPDKASTPQYRIIDFNGCLVDGRWDEVSSAFLSPRLQEDTLRFRVDVFSFAGELGNQIFITCHLKVTAVDQTPDALNKACSYDRATASWAPVEGTSTICNCCELGNCKSIHRARRLGPEGRSGGRRQRHVASGLPSERETEADVVLGPLVISDVSRNGESLQVKPKESAPKSPLGVPLELILALLSMIGAVALILSIFLLLRHKPGSPL
ncbi:zona pellucida sperm-binding protein 3-like [Tachyglossus aculeatus]|uniref:zona pellucida sperm-binding protein 3-like n=1 Tax=Tachyglossus aculeatus TaxID=9261 RepID=UPI0018F33340|nr:zona pellucida sperm-binding protein 3-like [Tachyglossus aculeatus]